MIIIEPLNNTQQADDYLNLVKKTCSQNPHAAYYINDVQQGIRYSLNSQHQKVELFKYYEGDVLKAQIALIIDSRLPKETAWFGFFECPNNEVLFKNLWAQLILVTKKQGVKELAGPINGTTWHAYRLIKSQAEEYSPFLSDQITAPYYYTFFQNLNPENEIGYYSGLREKTETLIKLTTADYQKNINAGVTFERLKEKDKKSLTQLFNLSNIIFKNNWGFVPLSENEFFELYASEKVKHYIQGIYIVKINTEWIGFCSVLQHNNQWVLKTMAILPEHQGKGLGNALVHKIHADAHNQGVEAMIYALVRDNNKIQHFPKDDARVISRYACFTFNL